MTAACLTLVAALALLMPLARVRAEAIRLRVACRPGSGGAGWREPRQPWG